MASDVRMFDTLYCYGRVTLGRPSHADVTLQVRFKDPVDGDRVRYVAAAPADHRASYSGSGLPFPNLAHALHGTPNRGEARLEGGVATLALRLPNAYYAGLGTILVPPKVYLQYHSGGQARFVPIQLTESVPYRLLTYPMHPRSRQDARFYDGGWELPVRSQEQILRDAAYPLAQTTPSNHWGLKPPM